MSRVLDLQHGRQGWVRLSLGSFTWFWLSPGSLSLTISSRVRNSPWWTFISPTCLFVLFFFLYFHTHMLCGMQDLSSLIKDQTCALCNGVLTTGPPGKCHYCLRCCSMITFHHQCVSLCGVWHIEYFICTSKKYFILNFIWINFS